MTELRREDGFTLVEMLLVCMLGLVIFGATMSAFTSFYGENRSAESQSDNLDEARLALDRESRQLRNLAIPAVDPTVNPAPNPVVNPTSTIYRAVDDDFIFQTSDPAKTWVRYCLDSSTPAAEKLWMSESATSGSAPPASMTGACGAAVPSPGYAQIVTRHVTNRVNGLSRRVFTYRCLDGAAGCPASSADYPRITTVTTHLWIDANPRDKVDETDVASGVFLRNQNQAPTAVAGPASTYGSHRVQLNGGDSSDPEERSLDYFWFTGTAPSLADLANCAVTPPGTVAQGPTPIFDFPVAQIGTSQTFWLAVRDPGCLSSISQPVTVKVPS